MFKTHFKRHIRIIISVGIFLFCFSLRSTLFLEIKPEFKAPRMLMHGSYRQPVLCNRFVSVKKKAPQNNGKSKKKRVEF